MRAATVRGPGTAAAAIAAGLLVTALAGCGSSPGGPVADGGTGAASVAPSACSLLRSADVLAVAATFRGIATSIDGHQQVSDPPLNLCSFNQEGVYLSQEGMMTTTVDGDQWARLTVIADGNGIGDYSPDGPAIHGLGNGAYWDPGSEAVVVLVGQNVFQVADDVPVDIAIYPNQDAVRQQAATALAAKILSHL